MVCRGTIVSRRLQEMVCRGTNVSRKLQEMVCRGTNVSRKLQEMVRRGTNVSRKLQEMFAKRRFCSCISRRGSPNVGKALAFRGDVRQMAMIAHDLHGFGRSHRTNLFWGFSRGRRPSIFAADNQHKSFNEHHTKTNPQEMASPIPYIICLCSTRHAGADPSRGLYERR